MTHLSTPVHSAKVRGNSRMPETAGHPQRPHPYRCGGVCAGPDRSPRSFGAPPMTTMSCYCCEVRDPNWETTLPVDLHPASPQPAAYLWIEELLGESPLCVDCCAEWRLFAATHPDVVTDLVITQLGTIR